jgi:hypothetical protein
VAQDKDARVPPLLYLLRAESLAELIRNNPSIMGVSAGDLHHRIYIYTDDVLLYISNPEIFLPFETHLLSTACFQGIRYI